MSSSAEILFKLLRIALGNESDLSLPSVIDWREVVELSYQQGVAAIAVDGLQKIYDAVLDWELELDKPELEALKYEWFGNTMADEQKYDKHCSIIAQISSLLSKDCVRMMLLKGVGCSLNYPVPSHRQVGDIDIYCFEKNLEANRTFESSGYFVEESLGHHSRMIINGVSVENHHSLMDGDNYRSNIIFEREIRPFLSNDVEEVNISGIKVLIPAPTLMTLHLLRHSGSDFASNTITIRQVLDYALLVDNRSNEIEWSLVTSIIDKLGMRGFFDAINELSVNTFGIERSKFPLFADNAILSERIMNDMLYAKKRYEFPDYHKKIIYGLAKTKQAWYNRWKNNLVFNEGFFSLYWRKAINRLKN